MNTKVDEGKLISGKEALIALANGEDVEWNSKGLSGENWHSVLSSPHTKIGAVEILKCEYGNDDVGYYSDVLFRLKPKTILINGNECPAPILWDSLPEGTKFWIADPSRHDGEFCRHLVWDGQDCDVQHLQRGLVHLSKQDAVEHAKAIILASGGSYE